MRNLLLLCLLADDPLDAVVRKMFSAELSCAAGSKDEYRAWCPATRAGTEKLALPKTKTTYLGLRTSVLDGDPVKHQIDRNGQLAVLCLGPDPGNGKVATLDPKDDAIDAALRSALTAGTGAIEIPPKLQTQLDEKCRTFQHGAAPDDVDVDSTLDQKFIRDMARLYKAGDAYVVLDTESSTRKLVAVFPTRPLKKAP